MFRLLLVRLNYTICQFDSLIMNGHRVNNSLPKIILTTKLALNKVKMGLIDKKL